MNRKEIVEGFLDSIEGELKSICQKSQALDSGDIFLTFFHKGSISISADVIEDVLKIEENYEETDGEVVRVKRIINREEKKL